MTRKRVTAVAVVLAVFGLGALVGYRYRGPHRGFAPSSGATMAGCVDIRDAGAHVGQNGCIAGTVIRVYTSSGGNTFLDFCPDYRTCPFTSVIFASDKSKFGNLSSLTGRRVELRGYISVYRDRPEIIIHDPEQIREAP